MKIYEIIYKKSMQIKSILCTEPGYDKTIKTIEEDGGEVIEVNLRKKIKK